MAEARMYYGVIVPNVGDYGEPRALATLARDAEAAGWDGFFVWDHLVFGPHPIVDPWVALAAIALSTDRIRLGPLVTPLPRRRPWKLARETVSLDHLSGGRLILGVGIGGGPWEWEHLGEVADLTARGAMLDEGLDVLTGLWSGRPFRYEGQYYQVEETVFLPRPVQSPRIPIWVAGTWPYRRPFRRAARWDGVLPKQAGLGLAEMMSPTDLRESVAYTQAHRTSTAPFEVVTGGFTPGDDPLQAADIVAAYADAGLTWWLETPRWRENVNPWAPDWNGNWSAAEPIELMRARIHQGPPKR
jgi:hypothetical protein